MKPSSSCIAVAVSVAALFSTRASMAQTVVVAPDSAPPRQPAPLVVAPAAAPPPVAPMVVVGNGGPQAPEQIQRPYTRPNRALLMSGLVLFGAPYVASIGIAATSAHAGDSSLWIPAVGPWLDVGARGGCPANGGCGGETGAKFLLVVDGILQTMGVLQVVGAFVFPETYVATNVATTSGASVRFAPTQIGRGGYGLTAVGQF
jgi:hypothetical protein